ncbi:MAC/perforin domain-containing protein [Sunxiuqinia elliptica]|uniref:MAC/Perforin domain-containing protein n=1 Tax=Sunxiuqinia elliptica TaxID=655355 RepID=A0A1I2CCI4_9BACT|nr:MAC/perforin domain-containing protein [Sunxiuqinia elliptica]SFE65380.1 MAC/Perforin domain-containing protein [Sunxiuqinia elliptica]
MKKGIFPIVMAVLLTAGFYACDNSIDLSEKTDMQDQSKSKAIVLKERDPNSPLILSKKVADEPERKLKSGSRPFEKYLGRSFKMSTLPLADYKNFGGRVIEVEDYLKSNPNGSSTDRIGYTNTYSFAYTNFRKYVEKSEVQKKVKGGFKLDLGLFSIGAKKSMERTFSKTNVQEHNRVFGELHYLYMDSRYWLTTNSYDVEKIKKYLAKNFLEHLYNNTPSEFFETYGGFVMFDFIVGGKAMALYSGVYQGNESSETRGKKMETDINASYGKKASGDFGFGRGYSTGKELSNNFVDLRASVTTLGGMGAIINFSNPEKVSSININLTNWLSSLNNKNNHSIIEFSDDGLFPITEFIKEDNLKYAVEKGISSRYLVSKFREPVLVYAYEKDTNCELIFLVTRYEDAVILHYSEYKDENYTANILKKYTSKYKIRTEDRSGWWNSENPVPGDPSLALSAFHLGYVPDFNPEINPLDLVGDKMKKFIRNNVTYLISQNSAVKFAFSIHDDYILDTYAIRGWINNMPTTQLTDRELDKYTIVAL